MGWEVCFHTRLFFLLVHFFLDLILKCPRVALYCEVKLLGRINISPLNYQVKTKTTALPSTREQTLNKVKEYKTKQNKKYSMCERNHVELYSRQL